MSQLIKCAHVVFWANSIRMQKEFFCFIGCGYLSLDIWHHLVLLYLIEFAGIFFVCGRLQKNYWRKERRDEDTFQISTLFLGSIQLFCSEEMPSWTMREQSHLLNKALKCISHFSWVISPKLSFLVVGD